MPSARLPGPPTPRAILLPYQRRWTRDPARFKLGLMSRQVGKDFASAEEGVRDCLLRPKTTWLVGAPSERQSLESLEKWKEWAVAYHMAARDAGEDRETAEGLMKSARLEFENGSRVIAVPGRPETVRGFSANLLLTEFAFFEDPDATWRAVLPSVSNPLRGGVKKVRLISTPNGVGNMFHQLWTRNYSETGRRAVAGGERSARPTLPSPRVAEACALAPDHPPLAPSPWSCHRVTIWDAVAEGLRVKVEELRAALADPEGWAQEFECEFLDTATVLLPYDLIIACESPLATAAQPPEFWSGGALDPTSRPPQYLGIDFGRKRDRTVCWTLEDTGNGRWLTREVLCLENLPTDQQLEHLRPRLRHATRVCLDYTGPGVGLGDFLARELDAWHPEAHRFGRLELCTFTHDLKCELFSKLRMACDQRALLLPISREVREDLHSLHRVATATGQITYRASHTADGHADRGTALALALRAASHGPIRLAPIWVFHRAARSGDRALGG